MNQSSSTVQALSAFITINEAAKICGVSYRTFRQWIGVQGGIPAVQGTKKVRRADVEAFCSARQAPEARA